MKKGKANLLPPKRGQIKTKIFEELMETVINVAKGRTGKKNERGTGSATNPEAFGYCCDEKGKLISGKFDKKKF